MTRFNRHAQVKAHGMLWQATEDGWERVLLRRMTDGSTYTSELVRVQADRPVCLACLGQEVLLYRSALYTEGELFCQDCGVRYGIV